MEIVRIGIFLSPPPSSAAAKKQQEEEEPRYRISLTSLAGLHAPFQGRFTLAVGREGEVLGVNWHAWIIEGGVGTKSKKNNGKKSGGHGEFELLVAKEGPRPVLAQGGGKGKAATGRGRGEDGEQEVEKSFFQK